MRTVVLEIVNAISNRKVHFLKILLEIHMSQLEITFYKHAKIHLNDKNIKYVNNFTRQIIYIYVCVCVYNII
jgi:hypothetical protein